MTRLGLVPIFGQGWLYLWSWQEDGEVMSPDGRHCTLDNPQTVKALAAHGLLVRCAGRRGRGQRLLRRLRQR